MHFDLFSRPLILRWMLGIALSLSLASLWQGHVEDVTFHQIVNSVFPATTTSQRIDTSEANAVLILHRVHQIVSTNIAAMRADGHIKEQSLWSASDHLHHPGGACASFTTVLAKTLQTAGFHVRKVGLAHDGTKAIHHVLEAFADNHWMLMDAGFDLSFTRPDGTKADAGEVASHWDDYRQQTPSHYPEAYDYQGFYYTNWDRIPGASLAFRYLPDAKSWAEHNHVSLRFMFLNPWKWAAAFWACLSLLLLTRIYAPSKCNSHCNDLCSAIRVRSWKTV